MDRNQLMRCSKRKEDEASQGQQDFLCILGKSCGRGSNGWWNGEKVFWRGGTDGFLNRGDIRDRKSDV